MRQPNFTREQFRRGNAEQRDNLDENGGGVSVGTRGEAPRSDRHTPASVFSFGMALLVIVTCQVAPPLEGEMRCPGDISTIIR